MAGGRSVQLGIIVTVIMAASANAVVIRHDRDDEAARKLGRDYPCVGRVGGASGTLIAPQWVLTAGHVARDPLLPAQAVEFAGQTYDVSRAFAHPKRTGKKGKNRQKHDVGLVLLSSPVQGVQPAERFSGEISKKLPIVIAGIGMFGDGQKGADSDDGILRACTNTVDRVRDSSFTSRFDKGKRATELEGMAAPGDSGGGVFLQSGQAHVIAGVALNLAVPDNPDAGPSTYGTILTMASVSHYAKWIDRIIESVDSGRPDVDELQLDRDWNSTASADLPQSPAGARASALVDAINTGREETIRQVLKEETLESFLAADGGSLEQSVGDLLGLHKSLGNLKVVGYKTIGQHEISLLVRCRAGKTLRFDLGVTADSQKLLNKIDVLDA
ncbi:MAG: trypsin-like serine protease [Planctomycetota bacterium]|jgi:hypothetical protein